MITKYQIELMCHCLGIQPNNKVTFYPQNRFIAGADHDDFLDLENLVKMGYMGKRDFRGCSNAYLFYVTEKGKEKINND